MEQFKLTVEIQIVSFAEHYHARLLSRRGDHWAVVGVFQLHPTEWGAVLEICANENIEIQYEPTARAALPAEAAAASE
jgi:hypothetical protein